MASNPTHPGTCRSRRALALAGVIILIALPLRLGVALRAEMISRDGVVFINYAKGLAQAPLAEMRQQAQHPLYPALILAVHTAFEPLPGFGEDPVADWTVAAVGVTLAGGLAVVVAVFLLTRTLFDERVAWLAAILAAITAEFCQLSGDALTDMPHLALYLTGLALGIRGVRDGRLGSLLGAGLLSGLAYLMRPEGAEVAVITVIGLLFWARLMPVRRRLLGIAVVCLGAAIVASPYMIATGKLVPKKSVGRLLWGQADPTPEAPMVPPRERAETDRTTFGPGMVQPACVLAAPSTRGLVDLARALGRILENWGRALRVTLLLPAFVWLARMKDRPAEPTGGRMAAVVLLLHLLILVALITHFDYWKLFSLRHVMILAGLSLPFSAAGLAVLLELVPAAKRRGASIALVLGLTGPTLPWMLETRFADDVYLRRAGEWIGAQGPSPFRVMTTRHRVAFYARGIQVWCPSEPDPAWILAEAREHKPDWLVFDETRQFKEQPSFFEGLKAAAVAGETLELVHAVESGGRKPTRALIYRYHPPS